MQRVQYGALPYRFDGAGNLEILLVTSLRSRRWIIPKGWPIAGLEPANCAAQEAMEEAGVLGRVDPQALGRFDYRKYREKQGTWIDCTVIVFPLLVEDALTTWQEAGQRELQWLPVEQATDLASDAGLKVLIGDMKKGLAAAA